MKKTKLRRFVEAIVFYLAFTAAYSVVRFPIGAAVLMIWTNGRRTDLHWAMYYPDLVIYWPFRAISALFDGFEHTLAFQILMGGWLIGFAITLVTQLGLWVFRVVRNVLEHFLS